MQYQNLGDEIWKIVNLVEYLAVTTCMSTLGRKTAETTLFSGFLLLFWKYGWGGGGDSQSVSGKLVAPKILG